MKLKVITVCCLAVAATLFGKTYGQAVRGSIPAIIEKNGRYQLLVDGQPYFILGGQAHNSSAWPCMLPQLWQAVEIMHANTLEVPVYWEQVEPRPGRFDFSIIDTLLLQSQRHKTRLVLLWFATWKNGSNHYMPEWMKKDAAKYPNITGRNGKPIDSPSPHADATLEADTRAFTAMMRYLRKKDTRHTVIMVQVENEPGSWGSVRDYSAGAQKLFESPVPSVLLRPELLKALNHTGAASGNWQTVFGDRADEYFQAWSIALFIGKVAAAGKAVYPLPMYANAALRDPLTNPSADNYESGGPTDNVIPIWKAAAPAIDLVAPDIYLSGSERILKVIELYNRNDNALFVPEFGVAPANAKYLYEVAAGGGIGFSPFGIDDNEEWLTKDALKDKLAAFANDYSLLAPMAGVFAKWAFEGKIKAVTEREDQAAQIIDLGAWQAVLSFGGAGRGNQAPLNTQPTGKAMVVVLEENKFVVVGSLCHISFRPTGNYTGRAWQYSSVKEGKYENGVFKPLRILNGDETDWGGPRFGALPKLLEISLILR